MKKSAQNIQIGDSLYEGDQLCWTAITDAAVDHYTDRRHQVSFQVRYKIGGRVVQGRRVWSNPLPVLDVVPAFEAVRII